MDRIASWPGIKKCAGSIITGHMRIQTPDVAALNVATGAEQIHAAQEQMLWNGLPYVFF